MGDGADPARAGGADEHAARGRGHDRLAVPGASNWTMFVSTGCTVTPGTAASASAMARAAA
ncbi:MAG: hypothetical protein WKG00_22085 [Polyangiaceae bacterium]